jgi:chromate transporter
LFENFYRNGIFVFGGGQVLVPFMFTEFVEMKHYVGSSEFLSGFALQQALPGPTFSFTSFIGALTLKNAGYGLWGQIGGSIIAVLGINLPGLILILFIVPFWADLKKIGRIKHSLSGINAVSVGFLLAAVIFMFRAQSFQWQSLCLLFVTFVLLSFTRIKTPILIFRETLVFLRRRWTKIPVSKTRPDSDQNVIGATKTTFETVVWIGELAAKSFGSCSSVLMLKKPMGGKLLKVSKTV